MRWKAVYLILALALFFGVMGCLFLNRLIEWSLERSLETAIGARVEIERVRLDLRRLTLDIGRMQVTNPRNTWRNFFEAGENPLPPGPRASICGKDRARGDRRGQPDPRHATPDRRQIAPEAPARPPGRGPGQAESGHRRHPTARLREPCRPASLSKRFCRGTISRSARRRSRCAPVWRGPIKTGWAS